MKKINQVSRIILTLGFLLLSGVCFAKSGTEVNGKYHTLSIGDNSDLLYRYRMNKKIAVFAGIYIFDADRTSSTGQGYKRKDQVIIYGLRYYFDRSKKLQKLIELRLLDRDVSYSGPVSFKDRTEKTQQLLFGGEYILAKNFSIEGLFGLGRTNKNIPGVTDKSTFGPTTHLAVNYLF